MAISQRAPEPPPAPADPLAITPALETVKALRAEVDAWVNAGKALMDRMVDLVHDSKRR